MNNKITIRMPESVKSILDVLHQAGYEAYVVGGCVRDAILGRSPDDWDITTNAKPMAVKKLFDHTIDTGLQHGTVTVMIGKVGYEVTTYRVDGAYEDHRRPTEVSFTSDLKEDMLRRDFTINAMAYNDKEGLVDYFEGQKDLDAKVIRCMGNPYDRFDEDALRVLRALRFAAQLDFVIAPDTRQAMMEKALFLKDISAERIRVELTKLVMSDHPDFLISIGYDCGITKIIFPEFDAMVETAQENPHHQYNVGMHCIKAVENTKKDSILRWTVLLHDVAKPMTKTIDENGIAHFYEHAKEGSRLAVEILKRFKFDNETIKRAKDLIYWHDYFCGQEITIKKVRRAMNKIGPEWMDDLLLVWRSDIAAQSAYQQKEKLQKADLVETLVATIRKENQCVTLKQLAIGGQDLIALGMRPGKELGEVLQALLKQVIDDPSKNERDYLIEQAKKIGG